jgi:hypothetical protein
MSLLQKSGVQHRKTDPGSQQHSINCSGCLVSNYTKKIAFGELETIGKEVVMAYFQGTLLGFAWTD